MKKDGCEILGYVIMPNHLHCLLAPFNATKPLNKLVGEGKRFMAYSIVRNLKKGWKNSLLKMLEEGVQENEKVKCIRFSNYPLMPEYAPAGGYSSQSGKWQIESSGRLY